MPYDWELPNGETDWDLYYREQKVLEYIREKDKKNGTITSENPDYCDICNQQYGLACDGAHKLCPTHKNPYIGDECRECLMEDY